MTEWVPVLGFEGLYEASAAGAVRRVGGSQMSPYLRGGYPCVTLRNGQIRKARAVHLVVIEAFRGAPPPKHQCAHLDGNAQNAALSNLAYVTKQENEAHKRAHGTQPKGERSHFAKLTDEQASIIREVCAAGISQTKVARLAGVSEDAISGIVRGKRYK